MEHAPGDGKTAKRGDTETEAYNTLKVVIIYEVMNAAAWEANMPCLDCL